MRHSLAFVCVAVIVLVTHSLQAAEKLRPEINTDRLLFLGNSITRHGVLKDIGWTTDWGMAASALDKDYVHVATASIAALRGSAPEMKLQNIADFERNLASYDLPAKLKDVLEFKPTLVVVAIGENVPGLKNDAEKEQFKISYTKLLALLKESGTKTIVCRSSFWADAAKDSIMREACAAAGGIFVDIGTLGKDEANFARSERKWDHAGVAAHPGDKGMKAIADAIVRALMQ